MYMIHIHGWIGAEDGDTSPENITFVISGATSGRGGGGVVSDNLNGGRNSLGFLSFKMKADVPINRFTQSDLRRKRVIFTHTGI